jgi:hypothetical protein
VSLRTAYRYTAGRLLDGTGTGSYLRPGTGTWWQRRPGWQRQAVRLSPVAYVAGVQVCAAHPWLVLAAAAVAGVPAARWARGRWRMRRFRATYIRPTLGALRPALGDAPVRLHVDPSLGSLLVRLARPMSPAERWVRERYGLRVEPVLRWAPDHLYRGRQVVRRRLAPVVGPVITAVRRPAEERGPRIELRAGVPYLTPEQRQLVDAVLGAKLPAGELTGSWDMVGSHTTGTWTVRRRPPERVGYDALTSRFERLAEDEYFIGLGTGGEPVKISLSDDSPHIACSAGSGAGKSVLAQLVAVQVLARGGQVVILDRKGSHRWALGLPAVDYCTEAEQMHHALLSLAKLADRRNRDALREPEGWDPGPRVLLIAEELNGTIGMLRGWWEDNRLKSDPKASPAIRALGDLLFMGRSAKVNCFAVAQMLTARAIGGPEARENFGIRCLARYTSNAWKMLVPEAGMPRASRTTGRWQIVVGGVARETQVCFLTASQARLFVASRAVHVPADTLDGPLARNVHMDGQDHVDIAPEMTLQDSINERLCDLPLPTLQKRLQRARSAGRPTPTPVGKRLRADLYPRDELISWLERELTS